MTTYKQFKAAVATLPVSRLRCEVAPSDDVLRMINAVGLARWTRYVRRLEAERAKCVRSAWQPGDAILY